VLSSPNGFRGSPNRMSSKTAAAALGIVFIASTAGAYYATDRSQDHWGVIFWGIIGSNASVLGIIYALVQLRQIRKEAELIAETSKATRNEMLKLAHFGDIKTAIKLIQEIQTHLRMMKHEIAVLRLQELKIIVGQVKVAIPSAQPKVTFDGMLLKLNFMMATIEKDIENKTNLLVAAHANGELESILDSLVVLQSKIFNRT